MIDPAAWRPSRFVLIAAVCSVIIIALAIAGHVGTYRVAPVFLIPMVWGMVFLRRRLHLHPAHFAIFAGAVVLHMLGAFGFYQRGFFGVSFDVYVHFFFALAGTFIAHRFLRYALPLRGWSLRFGTLLVIMGIGGVHEVMEYASYLLLGEERGMLKTDSYIFDTSRDLTSNFVGCVLAMIMIEIASMTRRGR